MPEGRNISRPSTRFGLPVSKPNPGNCRAWPTARVGTGFSVTCAKAALAQIKNGVITQSFFWIMDVPVRRDAGSAPIEDIKHQHGWLFLCTRGRTRPPVISAPPHPGRDRKGAITFHPLLNWVAVGRFYSRSDLVDQRARWKSE